MEKRFALFLVLAALVLFLHMMIQGVLAPRKPVAVKPPKHVGAAPGGEQAGGQQAGAPKQTGGAQQGQEEKPKVETPSAGVAKPVLPEKTPEKVPHRRVTLGSLAPDSPYRLLITFNNQGAAIERIELTERTRSGAFRYRELYAKNVLLAKAHYQSELLAKAGYLGHLAPSDEPDGGGCRVNVVGPGTPAAEAQPKDQGVAAGLRVGDVVKRVQDAAGRRVPIRSARDFAVYLARTKPGETIELSVSRQDATGATVTRGFTITLTQQPLSLIRPEVNEDSKLGRPDPLSFLFTLESIGNKSLERGFDELQGLPSLHTRNWEVAEIRDHASEPAVEFRFRLTKDDLQKIGVDGELLLVKRFRLAPTPQAERDNGNYKSYHLTLETEIHNLGPTDLPVAYRLDGPNGLPLEGWWYSRKTHPTKFSSAGARDVVWRTPEAGHGLLGATRIYSETKKAEEKNEAPSLTLFADLRPQPVDYLGVDTQYFTVAVEPQAAEGSAAPLFQQAIAVPAGDVGEKKKSKARTTNVTFQLISDVHKLAAGETYRQRFVLFAGPKQPDLLAQYGLERCIAYGWFGMVAKPLSKILHWFEWLPLVNYGLAIIMLTVLVRSCMIPLSRKAARNAQMMQELAPEMKRIAEKYKNDMEKRAAAQRELFAKHNYNPFGGCLLMFVQLPIFIGLYRSLAVDIELRQAPLIPGLDWCANLAGPDMLFYWKDWMPGFLANEAGGWLGPYFNALPLLTIVLFLAQQKMFMPPAADDQSRMQQKVMKFMMVFMGFLFFRVASGLCVYFIASSLWGIAERKLLPPPGKEAPRPKPKRRTDRWKTWFKPVPDGAARRARIKKRQRKRR